MKKAYFDTSAIIMELFSPEHNPDYSVENRAFKPFVSLTVKQEIFHNIAHKDKSVFNNYDNDVEDFVDAKELMSEFFIKTRLLNTNLHRVNRRFESLVEELTDAFDDFPSEYSKRSGDAPDGHDIVHFSYADAGECEIFITCDGDFEFFKGSDRVKNISKIVVLDSKDYTVENEFEV